MVTAKYFAMKLVISSVKIQIVCLWMVGSSLVATQADWMQNLPDTVKARPMTQLKLLGSHDSGAYRLNLTATPPMEETPMMDWVVDIARDNPEANQVLRQVTLAQRLNISEQLQQGIRALDLRILYNSDVQEFFMSHSMATDTLSSGLAQIRQFMTEHPGELIVIQMQDDAEHGEMTAPHNHEAISMVHAALGQFLIPVTQNRTLNSTMTLGTLVKSNKRILFSFLDRLSRKYGDIWSSSVINTSWPNGQTVNESLSTIQTYLPALRHAKNTLLNLVFFTITPTKDSIIAGVIGEALCGGVADSLFEWASQINAASMAFISQNLSLLKGLNIISIDNPSDGDVEQAIAWNYDN